MAEGMHSSSDIPNFDTYPTTPPDRLLDSKSAERSALEQHATDLGAAAGRIALIMRQTKENLENLAQHSIYDRLIRLSENARIRSERLRQVAAIRAQELTHAAQDRAAELGRQTQEKAEELGRHARANYYRARLKAKQTARDYPVETALAAGAVGFVVGVALRIGRANRAY
ncbi:MAG TPA: hypothetical protein VGJ33_08795 [Candidatus Angelobacter sp.]|jgi:ElaB/YqjD/DUF883 family membrane-anchored ribosome-binding protein